MKPSLLNYKKQFKDVLHSSQLFHEPFKYWTLTDALPLDVADDLADFQPPKENIAYDTQGERATRNSQRIFINEAMRQKYPKLDMIAHVLDSADIRSYFEDICSISLKKTALRIEFCCDGPGFWLKPHRDIGAKKLTLIVPLSKSSKATNWGTDLLNANGKVVARASAAFNSGLLFIPGDNTWHGFSPRSIQGLRRTLIINYVSELWKSRHELAFNGKT